MLLSCLNLIFAVGQSAHLKVFYSLEYHPLYYLVSWDVFLLKNREMDEDVVVVVVVVADDDYYYYYCHSKYVKGLYDWMVDDDDAAPWALVISAV